MTWNISWIIMVIPIFKIFSDYDMEWKPTYYLEWETVQKPIMSDFLKIETIKLISIYLFSGEGGSGGGDDYKYIPILL